MKNCLTLFLIFFSFCTKATAQQWRVVEKVSQLSYAGVYKSIDSIVYRYHNSSNRGSSYNNDTIHYDSFIDADIPLALGTTKGVRVYNAADQVLAENIYEFNRDSLWENRRADSFTYSNGKLASHRVYIMLYHPPKYILTKTKEYQYLYNAQNELVSKISLDYISGTMFPITYRAYYTYNSNNQLTQDSVRWIRNGIWEDFELYNMSYNTNGDTLLWEQYSFDTLGSKALFRKIDYDYNAQGQLMSDSLSYGPGNTAKHIKHTYVYDAQGRLIVDTVREYGWMAYNSVVLYSYTPFNYHSEVEFGEIDSVGNVSYSYKVKYKYQHYWPVNIKQVASATNNIKLYPNPASNILYIGSKGGFDKGYIYNSTGQLVKEISTAAKQIDVSTLPTGNYILQLSINDETRSQQLVILR